MKKIFFFFCIAGMLSCNQQETGTSWALLPFQKVDSLNPVLAADSTTLFHCPLRDSSVAWEAKDVFNPATVVRHDTLFLLYRAEDVIGRFAGTSRIGLAWSTDGLRFHRTANPVLYPDKDSLARYEWEGGCEDPRITEDSNGRYIMTYTSYDGDKARLMVASSTDLYHWTKHGLAFGEKWISLWSKSGSIISKLQGSRIIATRINGKYQMYFGDTDIFLAESEDCIHWTPVTDSTGKPKTVFGPRKGKFDSDLVEPGPPALITKDGILLLYNCRNVPSKGDTTLAEGTYAPSQILLDPAAPGKVLQRLDSWFLKPEQPYEINGQVNHVCFIEGLAFYKNRWFLYYGTADSWIAVAVSDQPSR